MAPETRERKDGSQNQKPGTTTPRSLRRQNNKHSRAHAHASQGTSTKNSTATPNLGPQGWQAQRQGRPRAADWALQPSPAPADASPVQRPNPGLGSHLSGPSGRPKGVVTTRGHKRPRPEEGRGRRTGPTGTSRRTGSETGSTGPESRPGPGASRLGQAKAVPVRPLGWQLAAPPPLQPWWVATHDARSQGDSGPEADESGAASTNKQ